MDNIKIYEEFIPISNNPNNSQEEINAIKSLKKDVERVLTQKVATNAPSGTPGQWVHGSREPRLEEILDGLRNIIEMYS